jgi:L-rhamnose isomerase
MSSAVEVPRAFIQANMVDRLALSEYQESNDVLNAAQTRKAAIRTDVSPILAMACVRAVLSIRLPPSARVVFVNRRRRHARQKPAPVRAASCN